MPCKSSYQMIEFAVNYVCAKSAAEALATSTQLCEQCPAENLYITPKTEN